MQEAPDDVPQTSDTERMLTRKSVAWALYDVGYMVCTFAVFGRFLAPWFINDLDHPDWYFSAAQLSGALVLVLLMPTFGALADANGARTPFLATFTVAAAVALAILGTLEITSSTSVLVPLSLASVAAVFTSLAFAQYDPLLARAAPPGMWGAVSGVAVGAAVTIAAVALLPLTLLGSEHGKQATFAPAAAVLVLLMVPLLVWLREPVGERLRLGAVPGLLVRSMRHAFSRLARTVRQLGQHEGVGRLVAARFLYTDAIGTVNVYITVYLGYLGGFSELETTAVVVTAVLCTALGALVSGWLVSRTGPRTPLLAALPAYVVAVATLGITGAGWAVWAVAPLGGLTLGTVWTADRVFMLHLTPPDLRGELFGLFNLVGRVAQSVAPLILWGGVNWLLHDGTGWTSELTAARVSLVLLAGTALAGAIVLWRLEDHPRYPHG